MKDQWHQLNIDLNKLSEAVKQFFTQSQFETILEKRKDTYQIEAKSERILGTQLQILVVIYGDPNDFTIEFTTDKQRKGLFSPSMIASYASTMLGGGVFLRSELKLRESLDRLEKLFWDHVDQQVAALTNSAKT